MEDKNDDSRPRFPSLVSQALRARQRIEKSGGRAGAGLDDKLPEFIRQRRRQADEAEQGDAAAAAGEPGPDADGLNSAEDEVKARFYEKARALARRAEARSSGRRPGFQLNFRTLALLLVFLGCFMAFRHYQDRSVWREEFNRLQASLPVEFDESSTLRELRLEDQRLVIEIERSEAAVKDLPEDALSEDFDAYLARSGGLCRLGLFRRAVERGYALTVILKAQGSGFERSRVVASCGQTQ